MNFKSFVVLLLVVCFSAPVFAKKARKYRKSRNRTKISQKIKAKKRRMRRKRRRASWVLTPVLGVSATSLEGKMQSTTANFSNAKSEAKTGFSIGLNLSFPTSSRYFGYDTGLFYSNSQALTEFTERRVGETLFHRETLSLERLSIPATVSLFPFRKRNGLYIKAGVMGHYLMNASNERNVDFINSSNELTQTLSGQNNIEAKNLNTVLVDAVAGVGYRTSGKNGVGIIIEGQYQKGLTQLYSQPEDFGNFKVDSIQAIVGLNIRL